MLEFGVGDFDFLGITALAELGADLESLPGGGVGDQVHDDLVAHQRSASPVLGDMAEDAVFDLVPLAGAGRTMANVNGNAQTVGQFLQRDLPQTAATRHRSVSDYVANRLGGTLVRSMAIATSLRQQADHVARIGFRQPVFASPKDTPVALRAATSGSSKGTSRCRPVTSLMGTLVNLPACMAAMWLNVPARIILMA